MFHCAKLAYETKQIISQSFCRLFDEFAKLVSEMRIFASHR